MVTGISGDYNADGAVNAADATILNNFILFSTYNIYADINGDGAVNSANLVIVQTRQGTSVQ
ncbi:MAG TPA: dockerin type I domain-containing protein [Bryobacteraceae bacterium]|nr:dockerin type I domain-containing protein [Bryobacteraceae bacterium]